MYCKNPLCIDHISVMFSLPSIESETLNDIVLDLTGVDLTEIRKEDLSINKNYEERSVSAMSVASTESSEKPVRLKIFQTFVICKIF